MTLHMVESPRGVTAWLSRRANGQYMLTEQKPQLHRVGKTMLEDFYVPLGDAIGVNNLCQPGVIALSGGLALRRREQVRVRMFVEVVGEPWMIEEESK